MSNFGVSLINAGTKDRRGLDFYPTPPNVTEVLIEFLNNKFILSDMRCLEPACGTGEMSKVLKKYFHKVDSMDIRKTGYGNGGVDYLNSINIKYNALITNPPFNQSQLFIEKAITEGHDIIAMLLKSQYWHSKKRRNLFLNHTPTYILPLTWRPDFYFGEKSGSPTMEVLWTVWINDGTKKECIYYPLAKK